MTESVYECVKIDSQKKQMIVKETLFRLESEDYIKAKKKERNLFNDARKHGYIILCKGKIIYDYLKEKESRKKEFEKTIKKLLELKEALQNEKVKRTSISFLKLSIQLELIKASINQNLLSENQIQGARI